MSQQGRCINPLRRRSFVAVAFLMIAAFVVAPRMAAAQQKSGPPPSVISSHLGPTVIPEGVGITPITCDINDPPPECAPSNESADGGEGVGGVDEDTGVIYPDTFTIEFTYGGVLYIGTAQYQSNGISSAAYAFFASGMDGSHIFGGILLTLGEAILLDTTGITNIDDSWVEDYLPPGLG